jgi:hypothetical protein
MSDSFCEKARHPPEKSLTDRSYELLYLWIGANVRPVTVQSDTEELARESVRWCRALEAEVAHETKRQEQKPRAARRPVDDEEEWP